MNKFSLVLAISLLPAWLSAQEAMPVAVTEVLDQMRFARDAAQAVVQAELSVANARELNVLDEEEFERDAKLHTFGSIAEDEYRRADAVRLQSRHRIAEAEQALREAKAQVVIFRERAHAFSGAAVSFSALAGYYAELWDSRAQGAVASIARTRALSTYTDWKVASVRRTTSTSASSLSELTAAEAAAQDAQTQVGIFERQKVQAECFAKHYAQVASQKKPISAADLLHDGCSDSTR